MSRFNEQADFETHEVELVVLKVEEIEVLGRTATFILS